MHQMPYDASKKSLYNPGEADNFFEFEDTLKNEDTLCAEMSRLAYVKEETRLADYLARVDYQLHKTWGYGAAGTQIFIAKSVDSKRIVVAFRGTEPDDLTDIASDADLRKRDWIDETNTLTGYVHRGFAEALLKDASNGNILADLSKHINTMSDDCDQLFLTGHSLGAAVATLTAAYFIQSPIKDKIKLVTLGSPLVGDSNFAENTQQISHHRVVNCCDIVTRLPPEILGYKHTGTLCYLDSRGQLLANPVSDETITEDRIGAAAEYFTRFSFRIGIVGFRELADHAPINYLSGIAGLRN
jgi:hypothetical protein